MFTLKAPLVEEIVRWKMGLYSTELSFDHEKSPHEKRQQFFQKLFELRRNLWTKPVQWLKAEIERNNTDKFLLGQAAMVR